MTSPTKGARFSDLCRTLEAVASVRGRNEKVRLLSEYLAGLPRDALPIACRFMAGTGGKTNVGWAAVNDAVREVFDTGPGAIRELYLSHGDLGVLVQELMKGGKKSVPLQREELTVPGLQAAFDELAKAGGRGSVERRKKVLVGLLLQCSGVEAKYLIKILSGELRTGATEGTVLEALGKAFAVGRVRDWYLILGDVGALADRLASGDVSEPSPRAFTPVAFMLPLPLPDARSAMAHFGKPVFGEHKYDGVRLQAHRFQEGVKLYSRRMEDVTASFPEVSSALSSLRVSAILDGEVVGFDAGRHIPFVKLQQRLHRRDVGKRMMEEVPLRYYVFDLLYLEGRSMLRSPLAERRRALEGLDLGGDLRPADRFHVEDEAQAEERFRRSRKEGYEGLVLKDPGSGYTPGRRGGLWVKLKEEMDTLDAVIVLAEWGNGKRAGLLSDYTFAIWDGGDLKPIGKAYSGLTDAEIGEMTLALQKIKVGDVWNGIVVKPAVVLEVAFDSVQRSARHSSGFALRFPRIKAVRRDKRPEDADTIEKVRSLYESTGA
ncbi:MAG: ATP-dependent DNA ligase [Nitrososphaerota archaeon]|nr:ATP-dependent DNA ligase [Nitrososphaerota archaeon]